MARATQKVEGYGAMSLDHPPSCVMVHVAAFLFKGGLRRQVEVGRESGLRDKEPIQSTSCLSISYSSESFPLQVEETILSATCLHCLVSDFPLYRGKCYRLPNPDSSEIPFPSFIQQISAKQ